MLARVRDYLAAAGIDALLTREPGGSDVGEALRRVLTLLMDWVEKDAVPEALRGAA